MVVTRFAPSPTGYLHIGGLRTALFSWLWARKNGGNFLLRIEDTDMKRNSEDAMKAILEAFDWVGLDYDGEVVYQSKRFGLYAEYIERLLEEGKAYRCYMGKDELDALRQEQMARGERPRYDGRYRDFDGTPPEGVQPVIRIKAPLEGEIVFSDGIKGEIRIAATEVDDFIIARSDGTPTYNFVVAIDDALMGLTDVIRGDDHLYNTPKQLVVYEALGFPPRFYHVPMINNEEGRKLSKRDGALDVMEYRKMGYLPEALLNFLVRLGWSRGDQEIFSIEEMLEYFDPSNINKSASSYNLDKLVWLNGHYINNTTNERLARLLKEDFDMDISGHDRVEFLLDATKTRSKTLVELRDNIELIIESPEEYDPKALKKAFKGEAHEILADFARRLQSYEGELHLPTEYHRVMEEFVKEREIGFGKIGQPLRVALLGRMTGPGMDEVMAILGVRESVERISRLLSRLEELKAQ